MIREAIDRILEISLPTIFEVDGRQYSTKPLNLIFPKPTTLEIHTLTGIADYIAADLDDRVWALHDRSDSLVMLMVESYAKVALISRIFKEGLDRHIYITATAIQSEKTWGTFMPPDLFKVTLLTRFVETPELTDLLALVGKVIDEEVKTYEDDGISQTVKTKSGAVIAERVIPKWFALRPYVTFPEVPQPECRFAVRLKRLPDGMHAALFEVKGAEWQREAIQEIKGWLQTNTEGVPIIA
jgi:hypothetical protein